MNFSFCILTVVQLLLIASAFRCFSQPLKPVYFDDVLGKRVSAAATGNEWNLEQFCPVSTSVVSLRVLQSYGAVFVANDSVKLPSTCIYKGDGEVTRFQKSVERKPIDVNGVRIDLQARAASALESAIGEAAAVGLTITAFDGAIAGGRTYGDSLMLWNSRVFPAMEFWIKRGRLSAADRDSLARLDLSDKIAKVLEWESQGIFFSTDRTRSIFTSTAPPGASQHLALLAFDVTEYWNSNVRAILNRNGWFQTVVDDPVHFTYLGFPESELPARGLTAVAKRGQLYWIPNMLPRPAVGKLVESSAERDADAANRRPQ
jgi:hypothetical protein